MHQEEQATFALKNSNGRGQPRGQGKRSENQPEYRSYELSSDSSCLKTEYKQQVDHICFLL